MTFKINNTQITTTTHAKLITLIKLKNNNTRTAASPFKFHLLATPQFHSLYFVSNFLYLRNCCDNEQQNFSKARLSHQTELRINIIYIYHGHHGECFTGPSLDWRRGGDSTYVAHGLDSL